jgi:hypothetical protein
MDKYLYLIIERYSTKGSIMPGPKPSAINLSDVEREYLELLVRRVLQPDNGKAVQMDISRKDTYCPKLGLFKSRCISIDAFRLITS